MGRGVESASAQLSLLYKTGLIALAGLFLAVVVGVEKQSG